MAELQQKWEREGELIVSSRGYYIYHCPCGATTSGNLSNIRVTEPYIRCLNEEVGCRMVLRTDKIIKNLGRIVAYRIKGSQLERKLEV